MFKCAYCNNKTDAVIKVKRWPKDTGVWQCLDCAEEEAEMDNMDLDASEERRRRRIAESNEY